MSEQPIINDIFSTPPFEHHWPAAQHVIFDCDSTLSTIEGIDVLAKLPQHKAKVEELTNAAMNGQCNLEDVYEQRLELLSPSRADVVSLASAYQNHIVDDALGVISTLTSFGIDVYIVSGGLLEPVSMFGRVLGIPAENIRAVPIVYDELADQWWRSGETEQSASYYRTSRSELTDSNGKPTVINDLLEGKSGRSMLIGDGVSDLRAQEVVDLFVGFGGVVNRQLVEEEAMVYVNSQSLLPLLPLALGNVRFRQLKETNPRLYEKSCGMCCANTITFKHTYLRQKFDACFRHLRLKEVEEG